MVARGGMRLPFVWVLMGCIGGFGVLGLAGLVIGPVVLSAGQGAVGAAGARGRALIRRRCRPPHAGLVAWSSKRARRTGSECACFRQLVHKQGERVALL